MLCLNNKHSFGSTNLISPLFYGLFIKLNFLTSRIHTSAHSYGHDVLCTRSVLPIDLYMLTVLKRTITISSVWNFYYQKDALTYIHTFTHCFDISKQKIAQQKTCQHNESFHIIHRKILEGWTQILRTYKHLHTYVHVGYQWTVCMCFFLRDCYYSLEDGGMESHIINFYFYEWRCTEW